MMSIY